MKLALRIYGWIILSVIMQVLILLYVDKVYIGSRIDGQNVSDHVKLEIQEFKPEVKEIDRSITVKLPKEDIKDIAISFDGLYVSYVSNGKINITDVKNQESKIVIENKIGDSVEELGQLAAYKWMADRNIIIFALKAQLASGNSRFTFLTYNVDTGDYDGFLESPINYLPKDSEITDFEFSSKTKVLYAKIKISSTKARIFRYNIMENLSQIGDFDINSTFDMTKVDDYAIIQDNAGIQLVNGVNPWKRQPLASEGNYRLLKVDTEDMVYVGVINSQDKVEKILYGKYNQSTSEWNTITLNKSAGINDIIIKDDGSVYHNAVNESLFYSLTGGKNTSYKGNLIDILANCYIIQSEGNIKIIPFKNAK